MLSVNAGGYMRAIGEKMINPALQDAQVNARSVLDACPDGLVSFDGDLRIVLVNQGFIALTGLDRDALIGGSIDTLGIQIDRNFVSSSVSFAFGASRSCRALLHEVIDRAPPAEAGGEVLKLISAGGRVIAMRVVFAETADCSRLLVFRDVTMSSRRRRRKNDFIAHAAHELRTPLTAIHGFVQLLQLGLYPETERREMLETVARQSTEMLSVVNELLDLATLQAGRDTRDSHVNTLIGEWVDRMVVNFLPPPQRPKPLLSNLCGVSEVKIDCRKMQRAMLNILSNAYKYSPEGGDVTVVCRDQSQDNRDGVLIEVSDKGIGMTLADQELVWEPFHRGRNGRDIPGTGLGLNITKHIVEEFGGTIGLASRTGAGTTVSIWLPAVKNDSAQQA